jgi:integrase
MSSPNLKLFRRHDSLCTGFFKPHTKSQEPYAKEFRIYEADTEKRRGKPAMVDCSCMIYAEGTLRKSDGSKNYLRPKATGKREWNAAKEVAAQWTTWGDTKSSEAQPNSAYELVTVQQATDNFVAMKRTHAISEGRIKDIGAFFNGRLATFAAANNITFIQEMDNAEIWAEFRRSWKNMNPLHNRKPRFGENVPDVMVGDGTAVRLIGMLREFQRFCVSRHMLSENWATKDHGMKSRSVVEPKEPFSDEELSYIYTATTLKTDGRGFKVKRTGQQNATEMLAFLYTMRYTGLRISDVVRLKREQLVRFEHHGYTHAIWCNPKKTDNKSNNFVHISIQSDHFYGHPNLVKALEELPVKRVNDDEYFFLGGKGTLKTNITSWNNRVVWVLDKAEELMLADGKKFFEHPHPHKFRHTFAARLLQGGASLRNVAAWLGDTEQIVRKHYAQFCTAEQILAAGDMAAAMTNTVDRKHEDNRRKMKVVSTGKRNL